MKASLINLIMILFCGLFIVIGCKPPQNNQTSATTTTPTAAPSAPAVTNNNTKVAVVQTPKTPPPPAQGVTMENFNKLKTGMKYSEVVAIFGKEGEVLSENEIAGYKTVMYKWDGEATFSNMNATFQNGKLVSKAQFNLK